MRAIGQVATSATTQVPIYGTTYNEPTSGAQRSLKSSSANDASAGTGVRTVRITYYALSSGVITGPFVETVTLNGTSAVATVATNICLIEKLEALTAGSGGVAAGSITLYAANDGTGTAIAAIATGALRTFLAHHYVPTNGQTTITDVEIQGGDAAAATVVVAAKNYALTGGVDEPISGPYGTTATQPNSVPIGRNSLKVNGPARVRLLVTPGNTNAQTTYGNFGAVDEIWRVNSPS